MASNAPGACCAAGYKHEGTPTGTRIKIADSAIDAYLAVPPPTLKPRPNTAVLFVSDILGIWQNNQLLADRFAGAGYITLLPDLFHGDPFKLHKPFAELEPTDDALTDWVAKGSGGNNPHTTEQVDPIITAAIEYLRTEHEITKIAAVGYCYGAKYVVRFMRGAQQGGIDVGFVAHPSFVTEDELWAMRGPLSIAAPDTDLIFTAEKRRHTEEILKGKGEVYSISLYGRVAHGFAVRGDPGNPIDRWAEEEAFAQAVRSFDSWLPA